MIKPPRWVQPRKDWKEHGFADCMAYYKGCWWVRYTCGCGRKGLEILLHKGEELNRQNMACADCWRLHRKQERTERKRLYIRKRRGSDEPRELRSCAHCGNNFIPKRTTAEFCSTRCRVAAHRQKRSASNG
jgi:hypothetical protein